MKEYKSFLMAVLFVWSCSPPKNNPHDRNFKSLIELNKSLVETYFYEAWNKGNLEKLDEIIDTAYINHNPSTDNPPRGAAGLKPIIKAMRKGIPDLNYTIEEIIITEDRVVARVLVKVTHLDSLFGIPPTGKNIEIRQINVEYIKNGKIVEHWRVTEEIENDATVWYRQIGHFIKYGWC